MVMPAACLRSTVDEGIANRPRRRLIGAGEDDLRVGAVGRQATGAISAAKKTLDEQWRSHQPDQRPRDRPSPPGALACSEGIC